VGLERGADEYVLKSFETLQLIARIKTCLRKAKPADEDMTIIGDLFADEKRRSVRIKERGVSLSPKEYELVLFLLLIGVKP